jgi:PAS domain S-box-containing protein
MDINFTRKTKKKAAPPRKKAKSSRRRAQQPALSKEMYHVLFATMREAFVLHKVVLGKDGKPLDFQFVEVNPAFERLTGLKRSNIIGKKVSEVLPADQAPRIISAGKEALKRPVRFEHYASDVGKYFDAPAFSPGKGMFATIFIDTTELREANQVLRGLVEASPLAIVGMDADGNIKSWSRAAERLFGWTAKEIIGRANPTVPAQSRKEFASLLRRALHGESLTNIEVRRQRRDGSTIEISLSSAPLCDSDGRAIGVITLYVDITDKRKLEGQLRQSQKMEAIGQLAGGVAHDFNNLLTVILGECDINLETLPEDDTVRQSLEEIRAAGERAALLAGQLLMFSRKRLVELTAFSLNDILIGMNSMLRRLIGENLELRVRPAADLGLVMADQSQIEQVLMNLVVNARDAMPEGGILAIETADMDLGEEYAATHAGMSPGEYVMLAVSDTGIGMTDEVRAQIFEPFFTTKQAKGTGLGLATSYGIIKQFGGYIDVYTEVGTGTTMKVYLPRTTTLGAARSKSIQPNDGGNETILVVEDDAKVRSIAFRMLSALGYRVLTAANGDEALWLLGENSEAVHLLLTDVVLPKMGGRELAERARALRPKLKVLFGSGYTDDVILQHRLIQHDIAFVNKPYTTESLSRKVRETLDQESGAQS